MHARLEIWLALPHLFFVLHAPYYHTAFIDLLREGFAPGIFFFRPLVDIWQLEKRPRRLILVRTATSRSVASFCSAAADQVHMCP